MKQLLILLFLNSVNFISFSQIDVSFGTNGHKRIDLNDHDNYPTLMKSTLDNCFIVSSEDYLLNQAYLIKIKSNGLIDSSFASGLFTYTFPSGKHGSFYDIVQLADSSYFIIGNIGYDIFTMSNIVIKLDKNGQQDMAYNIDGKVISRPNNWNVYGRIFMMDNASYLIGGYYSTSFIANEFYLSRFDTGGYLDTTFADQGLFNLNLIDSAFDPKIIFRDDSQHYTIVGNTFNNNDHKILFIHLNDNGSLDSSFGINGVKQLLGYDNFYLQNVSLNNNQIYLLGSVRTDSSINKASIIKSSFLAESDSSFSSNGIDSTLINSTQESIVNSLVINQQGNFLIGGTLVADTSKFFIIKKLANYSNDISFGNNGLFITQDFNSRSDFHVHSCLLSDQSWILDGSTNTLDSTSIIGNNINMTYCKVSPNSPSILSNLEQISLIFYPCPATDLLYFENNFDCDEIQVFSIDGHLEKSLSLHDNIYGSIDISMLPNGFHFLGYMSNGKYCISKIIKE